MIYSCSLGLSESESAECQIGTLGEIYYEQKKQNGRQMLSGKLNNVYNFPNKSLRDLILVSNYMFSISSNTMGHILYDKSWPLA